MNESPSFLLFRRSLGDCANDRTSSAANDDGIGILSLLDARRMLGISHEPSAKFRSKQGNECHRSGVGALAIDAVENRYMVSGGSEGTLRVWDLERLESPVNVSSRNNAHKFAISSICFHPFDSGLFTTGSFDRTVKVFSLRPGTSPVATTTYNLEAVVYSHSISNHSAPSATPLLACATQSSHIRLIDPRLASSVQTLIGHTAAALAVAWHPTMHPIVASSSIDGAIRVWDVRYSSSCLGSLESRGPPVQTVGRQGQAHNAAINGIRWTADGSLLVSAGLDGKIKVWDAQSGLNTNVVFPPVLRNKQMQPLSIEIADIGSQLELETPVLLVPSDSTVLGFDLDDGRLLKRMKLKVAADPETRVEEPGRVTAMVFRKGGHSELYTGHASDRGDQRINKWVPELVLAADEEKAEISGPPEKTERQKALDKIFEHLTKEPIRFG